jgi:hypothetical protein
VHFFNQPYAYHAGFADQGFLYNDDGNLTLVWSAYDLDYIKIIGQLMPWAFLIDEKKKAFEDWLPPPPYGGRWRFGNSARCQNCKMEIGGPIDQCIYYLVFEASIVADNRSKGGYSCLKDYKEKSI